MLNCAMFVNNFIDFSKSKKSRRNLKIDFLDFFFFFFIWKIKVLLDFVNIYFRVYLEIFIFAVMITSGYITHNNWPGLMPFKNFIYLIIYFLFAVILELMSIQTGPLQMTHCKTTLKHLFVRNTQKCWKG